MIHCKTFQKPLQNFSKKLTYFIKIFSKIGLIVFQEIIWNKDASSGGSCAWGSWQSASNPCLRDIHEYIILASKGTAKVLNSVHDFSSTIENRLINFKKNDLLVNIWNFQTESAKKVNHPAPFPVELALRIILLYSKPDDLILDPFIGSGSVAIASIISKRHYVGYEIKPEYVAIAQNRIKILRGK